MAAPSFRPRAALIEWTVASFDGQTIRKHHAIHTIEAWLRGIAGGSVPCDERVRRYVQRLYHSGRYLIAMLNLIDDMLAALTERGIIK